MAWIRILQLSCVLAAAVGLVAACSAPATRQAASAPAGDAAREPAGAVAAPAAEAPPPAPITPSRRTRSIGGLLALRLPAFEPWPPPTPTSQDVLARALVVGEGAVTWGAVSERFDAALAAAGYEDRAYYAVPGGFALTTRIERIDREGRPLSEPSRWVGSSGRRAWTLESFLRELAGVPVGRYRALVFVFSDTPFQSSSATVTEAMAEGWRTGGLNRLPTQLRAMAYDEGFQCDVLVYEFVQGTAGDTAAFVEGGLSVRRHLAASQILDKLEAPR